MLKTFMFNKYELDVLSNVAKLIKEKPNDYKNALKEIMFSPIGIDLFKSLYILMFNDEIFSFVPDEYEEDFRFLLSGRGDYLGWFKSFIEDYADKKTNIIHESPIDQFLITYNIYYANSLISPYYERNKGDYEFQKINPHHRITEDELKKKYFRFYNDNGQMIKMFY